MILSYGPKFYGPNKFHADKDQREQEAGRKELTMMMQAGINHHTGNQSNQMAPAGEVLVAVPKGQAEASLPIQSALLLLKFAQRVAS